MFHQPAEIHHGDVVGDVFHDREVVGDEQVGKPQLAPELDEQVHDLGLDRDVEGRDRLVEHDELRFENERPGDRDPLPLATGELVRVTG